MKLFHLIIAELGQVWARRPITLPVASCSQRGIAYLAQSPWIRSGTVRETVVQELDFNEKFYWCLDQIPTSRSQIVCVKSYIKRCLAKHEGSMGLSEVPQAFVFLLLPSRRTLLVHARIWGEKDTDEKDVFKQDLSTRSLYKYRVFLWRVSIQNFCKDLYTGYLHKIFLEALQTKEESKDILCKILIQDPCSRNLCDCCARSLCWISLQALCLSLYKMLYKIPLQSAG